MNAIGLGVLALVMLFFLFRRARSLVGRQQLRPTAMRVRMGIFLVLGVLVLLFALGDPLTLGGGGLGLLLGIGIAWVGLRLTHIEILPEGAYYTPNTYVGLGVFAVFLLRFVYKIAVSFSTVSAIGTQPGAFSSRNALAQIGGDPLTTGAYFLLIGYYVCYYGALLFRFRSMPDA